MASTILDAARAVLAANADLATAFGRPADGARGWLWRDLGPDAVPEPLAVLGWVGGLVAFESIAPGTASPWVGDSEFQLAVYADDRAEAQTLGDQVADVLAAAQLTYGRGSCAALRRLNPDEPAARDPEPGSRGQRVYRQILRFRALTGG